MKDTNGYRVELKFYDVKGVFKLLKLLGLHSVHISEPTKLSNGRWQYPQRVALSKMKQSHIAILRDRSNTNVGIVVKR